MKARRTPWWHYVVALVLGLLAGLALFVLTQHNTYTLLGAPPLVTVLLVLLGILVLVLAWQVRQYAKGKIRSMNMDNAVNTLLLSKALGLAGAALAGWYGGQMLPALGHLEAEFYRGVAVECGVAVLVCLADMVIGIVGEYWCQLPPKEGPEHPRAKERERRRGLAAATGTTTTSATGTDDRDDSLV